MVKPMLRSRSKKNVQVKTPGGRTVTHYNKKKPGKKTCGRCGAELGGVPSDVSSVIRNLAKSKKGPTRPYSGVLCSGCVKRLTTYATRFEVKNKYPEYADMELQRDLTIEKFLPAGWYSSLSTK